MGRRFESCRGRQKRSFLGAFFCDEADSNRKGRFFPLHVTARNDVTRQSCDDRATRQQPQDCHGQSPRNDSPLWTDCHGVLRLAMTSILPQKTNLHFILKHNIINVLVKMKVLVLTQVFFNTSFSKNRALKNKEKFLKYAKKSVDFKP